MNEVKRIKVYLKNEKCVTENKSVDTKIMLNYYLTYYTSTCSIDFNKSYNDPENNPYKYKKYKFTKSEHSFLIDSNSSGLQFPRGLLDFIPQSMLEIVDKTTNEVYLPLEKLDDCDIKYCLGEFELKGKPCILRDDQVQAVQCSLFNKRGINQLATGAGKTIIACAIIKLLIKYNPNIKIMVCVPYDHLIVSFCEYFDTFKIDYVQANKLKTDSSTNIDKYNVIITTPVTMLNRKDYMPKIQCAIYDEVQHLSADTWSTLALKLINSEYSLGFSAKAIELNHIKSDVKISEMSMEESTIWGYTGKVILYIPASYYIERGILATPVLFSINNKLPDNVAMIQDWTKISKAALLNPERLFVITAVSNIFYNINRKILLLVNTYDQSFSLAELILKQSIGHDVTVGVSHGGNAGYIFTMNSITKKINKTFKKSCDVLKDFKDGKIMILIGTSHLDEGADIPDLDVCILAGLGKKSRRIIQRVGRSLRITKTGKYAYLIDLCDNGSKILMKHYRERLSTYTEDIGIPNNRKFLAVSVAELKNKVYELEEIKLK